MIDKQKIRDIGYASWCVHNLLGIYKITEDKITNDILLIDIGEDCPSLSFYDEYFSLDKKERAKLYKVGSDILKEVIKK